MDRRHCNYFASNVKSVCQSVLPSGIVSKVDLMLYFILKLIKHFTVQYTFSVYKH